MTVLKNIFITIFSFAIAIFFVYGSFAFGMSKSGPVSTTLWQVKKSSVALATDSKWVQSINISEYMTGSSASGMLFLEIGRLATAFVMGIPAPMITLSGSQDMVFDGVQGIISLYDPFSLYTLVPKTKTYQLKQITNGSFYISDETDGTVSIYSIDAVIELAFFDQGERMTDMILFPGMYIRFNPQSNRDLKWADLFRIMLVLGDAKSDIRTGLEFVNPCVDGWKWEDIFFMYQLPTPTRPLFQMLHLLFRDRIKQVDTLKSYANSRSFADEELNTLIYNPSKKNHYLLDDLRAVLSKAVQRQMDPADYRKKIDAIYLASQDLIKWNSVQRMLEGFLTDARFAIYSNLWNSQFDEIYGETANILGIIPSSGKGKFFQYLSDIYSRNIVLQRKDPTFSGIDTYTPTADGLKETLDNINIESKDYFDIALYAYQLLQKTQDKEAFTSESVTSRGTYELIDTLFGATERYIAGLPTDELKKSAYQTLVIQFYAPIASTLNRSLYTGYAIESDGKIYISRDHLDGDLVQFDAKVRENIESSYATMLATYEVVAPLYALGEQRYTLDIFHDSITRIAWFLEMIREWKYKYYQSTPYAGSNISGVPTPALSSTGSLELYQAPVLPVIVPTGSGLLEKASLTGLLPQLTLPQ